MLSVLFIIVNTEIRNLLRLWLPGLLVTRLSLLGRWSWPGLALPGSGVRGRVAVRRERRGRRARWCSRGLGAL